MKRTNRLLSLLLVFLMVLTLVPTTVFAAGNDGKTEATAVQCRNFAEFKSAMENSSVYYVELIGNANEELPARPEDGSGMYPATQVASNSGTKTLIISGNHTYRANGLYCNYATLILNSGRVLNIKGEGQLTFSPKLLNESGSVNAVVWNTGGGTLNVREATLKADLLNVATYGRAIYNEANLNITSGVFYGVEGKTEGVAYGAVDINKGTATITGGYFFAETKESVTTAPYSLLIDSAANVQLSGGVYQNGIRVADTAKSFSDYMASGYRLVKLYDKTQEVTGKETRDSVTVVDPAKIISHVDITLSNPVGGSAANTATASTTTTGAMTDEVEWYLINSDNSLGAKLEGNFVAGNNYRAIIFARPTTGYEFSESVSATVNGASVSPSRKQAGADGYVRLDFDITATADPDAVFTQQPSDQRISTLDPATATFKFSKEITNIWVVNVDTGNVLTEPAVGSAFARKNADGSYTVSGFSSSGAAGETHYAIRVKYDDSSALVYSRTFTITRATPYSISFEEGKGSATNLAGVTISYAIENEKVFITADSAPEGMEFDKWVVRYDSTPVTLENEKSTTTSFTMPAGEVILRAEYKASEHDIIVTNGKATVGAGSEISKAATGTVVTITADPAEAGKQFDKWEVIYGGVTIADVNSATTTFTMGGENVKVRATYKDAAPALTPITNVAATVTVPAIGAHPDFSATAVTTPDGAVERAFVSAWVKMAKADYLAGSDDWIHLTSTDVFEAGYYYAVFVSVYVKDGYLVTASTTGTINNSNNLFDHGYTDSAFHSGYLFEPMTVSEYDIIVTNGKATVGAGSEISKAATGTVVTITADPAEAGKQFDKWEVIYGGVTIADVNSTTTTFTMGGENVKVIATYKDAAPSHAHTYGETWKSDADNHWHECDCGDKSDIAAHSFVWKIDREATKTETGLKHEECSVCGAKRNENTVIDKLPDGGTNPDGNTGNDGNNTDKPSKDDSAKSPQTGDTTNLIGWLGALFISGGIFTALGITAKKKKESEAE